MNPNNNLFLGKRYERTNQFCIQYFPQSAKKQRECADVAERMYDCLEYITTDGDTKPIRGSKMNHQVVDGVLNFLSIMTFHGQDGRTDTNGNYDGKHGCEGRWLNYGSKKDSNGNCYKV